MVIKKSLCPYFAIRKKGFAIKGKIVYKNITMRNHERIIKYLSLATIVVASEIFISLPFFSCVKVKNPPPVLTANLTQLCHTDVQENQWKYIVIHHSATAKGNAARFDDYHRNKRRWEYG